jgi:hypothetical protein
MPKLLGRNSSAAKQPTDWQQDSHEQDEVQIPSRPVAVMQVPAQRLFGPKAAAKYLGVCEDTLKKMTDLEQIRAFNLNGRRAYRIEDLAAFVDSLPGWYDSSGEKSAKVVVKGNHDL